MGIASDVSRIKSNITAALAAIADKGVDVPDGSTSDALAGLIASIEAGEGGLQNNRMSIVGSGTFTVAERTEMSNDNRFILQHDCGVIPLLIQIVASTVSQSGDLDCGVFWRIPIQNGTTSSVLIGFCTRRASSSSYRYSKISSDLGSTSGNDWTTDHVNLVCYNVTNYFNAGITYTWTAYYAE